MKAALIILGIVILGLILTALFSLFGAAPACAFTEEPIEEAPSSSFHETFTAPEEEAPSTHFSPTNPVWFPVFFGHHNNSQASSGAVCHTKGGK